MVAILDIREVFLAILNLCVTVMSPIKFWLNPTYDSKEMNLCVTVPPIKFQLNRTYGLGGDVTLRISNENFTILTQMTLMRR